MKWIKASDGIPQEPHTKHWRLSETKTPMMWQTIKKMACSENNSDYVEWLDESPSRSEGLTHEEAMKDDFQVPNHVKIEGGGLDEVIEEMEKDIKDSDIEMDYTRANTLKDYIGRLKALARSEQREQRIIEGL